MKAVKKKIYLNNDCPKCSGAGVVLVLNKSHTQHREITCDECGGNGYFQTIQFLWPKDIKEAIQ